MNELSNELLWIIAAMLCTYAAMLNSKSFLRMIKRMKWLFISILVIYSFGTPGEYILITPSSISPTKEGCILGLVQLAKLLVALATLNILFSTSTKSELMTGLHLLLSPLKKLGINTDRFTARLLLTLDYVEVFASKDKLNFKFDQLETMLSTTDLNHKKGMVTLESRAFNGVDKILILLMVICVFSYIYIKQMHIKVPF